MSVAGGWISVCRSRDFTISRVRRRGAVGERVGERVETLWSARSDGDLVQVVEEAAKLRSVLAAVEAGAVAEADARGVARVKLHYTSTGDWLTHLGGLRKGAGRRVVERARALTGPLA